MKKQSNTAYKIKSAIVIVLYLMYLVSCAFMGHILYYIDDELLFYGILIFELGVCPILLAVITYIFLAKNNISLNIRTDLDIIYKLIHRKGV